jgi:hypothetical protein
MLPKTIIDHADLEQLKAMEKMFYNNTNVTFNVRCLLCDFKCSF